MADSRVDYTVGENGSVENNVRCTIDAACFGQIL